MIDLFVQPSAVQLQDMIKRSNPRAAVKQMDMIDTPTNEGLRVIKAISDEAIERRHKAILQFLSKHRGEKFTIHQIAAMMRKNKTNVMRDMVMMREDKKVCYEEFPKLGHKGNGPRLFYWVEK